LDDRRQVHADIATREVRADIYEVAALTHLLFPHGDHAIHVPREEEVFEPLRSEDVGALPDDEVRGVLRDRNGRVEAG
jgi:hypothetical protein